MKETILRLSKVSKKYNNKVVLSNVDLELNKSEFILIKGESGEGKSTLLNVIAFLEPIDSGKIFWRQKDISTMDIKDKKNIRRSNIGYIFQDYNLFENLTLEENLKVFLRLSTNKKEFEIEKDIDKCLLKFKMSDRKKIFIKFLSGGERQRVAIMRAFLVDKSIILADEPTANIDEINKKRIIDYFNEWKNEGKAVILVSHDDFYDDIADKVYILKKGNISIMNRGVVE
ncbi:ABC transporter ATP-binding protein [Vallitalea sp.]|jgi:ABC-type lipoprotein export system ATPase subunit|uniref:ABC transporter ATP-binding protein n=1 Tax=Vallitalea sp. TaxID=1882829 RepID=UPI0025EB5B3F|nr:ATP-binding cassette domain-containing protein [Vallitalea sp.]MCT4687325.1 ATP-binding cassette domain-containing protein [Vallitalea sp.]